MSEPPVAEASAAAEAFAEAPPTAAAELASVDEVAPGGAAESGDALTAAEARAVAEADTVASSSGTAHTGGADAPAAAPDVGRPKGGGKRKQEKRKFPSVLGELQLTVTAHGLAMPESRKNYLMRRREACELGIIPWMAPRLEDETKMSKKQLSKRNKMQSRGVLLDEAESDLFHAAFSDDLGLCCEVIRDGVDINVRSNADMDGIGTSACALHIAAVRGHVDIVTALLEAGADATLASGRGETPIQLATRSGCVDVVRMLRSVGAGPTGAEGALRLLDKAPAGYNDVHKKRMFTAIAADTWSNAAPPQRRARRADGDSSQREGKGRSRKSDH